MTIPAYIYARFSSVEQSKGSSLARQLKLGRAFIEKKEWVYAKDRELIDEGKSAYHGANRAVGSSLYEFEEKALAGHFANGAALVVEHIDRLTRQGYEEALAILNRLTSNGVTIGVTQTGRVFEAGKRLTLEQVITVAVEGELSRAESEKKSERIALAWEAKIAAAVAGDRKAMTKILPSWLERDSQTHAMRIIPHRANVVNEIYDWYIAGHGLPWMVAQLNGRNEPTWGYGKKANSAGWNTAFLHKVLTYRAVLGEFEPMARPRSSNQESSKGILIPDFYPQVITAEKFNRVAALRAMRTKWGGPATKSMANLFSGLARCHSCGGMMYFQSQQKAGRKTNHKLKDGSASTYTAGSDRSYLRCNNNRRGHQCQNRRSIRYEVLEKSLLDALFDFAMRDNVFTPSETVANLTSEIAERERLLEAKRFEIKNGTRNLLKRESEALADLVAELEQEAKAEEKALQSLAQRLEIEKGSARPEEDLNRLVEARKALHGGDADARYSARVQIHQSLKRLIAEMICDGAGDTHLTFHQHDVHMIFAPDGEAYGIVHQGPDGEDNWTPDEIAAE